jgi:hypothetical protein
MSASPLYKDLNLTDSGKILKIDDNGKAIAGLPESSLAQKVVGTHDINTLLQPLSNSISLSTQTFVVPTINERTDFIKGIVKLQNGETNLSNLTELTGLGFSITFGIDLVSSKKFVFVLNEFGTNRSWGAYLLDLDNPIRLTIQNPHTVNDGNSELISLDMWRQNLGSAVCFSGIHRGVTTTPMASNTAITLTDHSDRDDTLFHTFCSYFADKKIPGIQNHGFADASAPTYDIVISSGSGNETDALISYANELSNMGFRMYRNWVDGNSLALVGLTNAQGDYALSVGATWGHVEMNATTRNSTTLRDRVVKAFKESNYSLIGIGSPIGAKAKTGQFPRSVQSINSTGSSSYFSRADHGHAMTQNTPTDGDIVRRLLGGWRSQDLSSFKTDFNLTESLVFVREFASLPVTGDTSKLYFLLTNRDFYTWSGTGYNNVTSTTATTLKYLLSASRMLFTQNTQVVANDTTETVLATFTVPPDIMGLNGRIRINAFFSYTNNANNKIVGIRLNGVTTGSVVVNQNIFNQTLTTTRTLRLTRDVVNRNSFDNQIISFGDSTSSFATSTLSPITTQINTSSTQTAPFVIQILGTKAVAGDVLALEECSIEIVNPNTL